LAEALNGADAFVGVSAADVVSPEMIMTMAKNPIIFALANPNPEIHPDLAKKHRPDAIMATGRSDFPNQVNNVLGFPFIFRGALDVGATCVNEAMKLAAVRAIAALAKEDVPDEVLRVYAEGGAYAFGRDYLIPKPIDPRVLMHVAPAVAKAAMDSGVARLKIDIEEYKERIELILGPTKKIMRGVRTHIREAVKIGKKPLLVLPNGSDPRILRAAAQIYSDNEINLCLLGNTKTIRREAEKIGIKQIDSMATLLNPITDERDHKYADLLFDLRKRKGVSRSGAEQLVRNDNYYAALMVKSGDADGMITGLTEPYTTAVRPILEVIGAQPGHALAGVYLIVVGKKTYFFADCTVNVDPDAETLADIAIAAAEVAERFTDDPIRVAMLSFSSFGSNRYPSTEKIAKSIQILEKRAPNLVVDGEMQADVALNADLQMREFPFCRLQGAANVLIFPQLEAANISYKTVTNIMDGVTATGPLLVGVNKPANVLQRGATVEEIINLVYLTAEQAVVGKKGKSKK